MTEDLVRDTFRQQEHQVEGRQAELGPAVRRKAARTRAAKWWIAGGLTLVTALGVSVAGLALTRDDQAAPPLDTTVQLWRMESSLGAQAEIPSHWGTNDIGCNMTGEPTVVRGGGVARLCLTPEPPTKEVASFGSGAPDSPVIDAVYVTVTGVEARRAVTTLDKGRYHGWIYVPTRDVHLVVRTRSKALTDRILDSFQLADPDYLGCPAVRPPVTPQEAPLGGGLVPPVADSASVCQYARTPQGRLEASASFGGQGTDPIVAALNSAPEGRNPDAAPGTCLDTNEPAADAVILITAGAQVWRVWVTFGYCTGRGLDNGVRQAHLADDFIHAIMKPLKVGYSVPNGPGK